MTVVGEVKESKMPAVAGEDMPTGLGQGRPSGAAMCSLDVLWAQTHQPRGGGDISVSSGEGPSMEDQVKTDITRWACVSGVLGILAASEGLPGPALEEGAEASSTEKVVSWPAGFGRMGISCNSAPGPGRDEAEAPVRPRLPLILGPPAVWIK